MVIKVITEKIFQREKKSQKKKSYFPKSEQMEAQLAFHCNVDVVHRRHEMLMYLFIPPTLIEMILDYICFCIHYEADEKFIRFTKPVAVFESGQVIQIGGYSDIVHLMEPYAFHVIHGPHTRAPHHVNVFFIHNLICRECITHGFHKINSNIVCIHCQKTADVGNSICYCCQKHFHCSDHAQTCEVSPFQNFPNRLTQFEEFVKQIVCQIFPFLGKDFPFQLIYSNNEDDDISKNRLLMIDPMNLESQKTMIHRTPRVICTGMKIDIGPHSVKISPRFDLIY